MADTGSFGGEGGGGSPSPTPTPSPTVATSMDGRLDEATVLRTGYLSYRRSFFARFEDWLIEKVCSMYPELISPSLLTRILLPTVKTIAANSKLVLNHLEKISKSVRSIEANSVEGVLLLKQIESAVNRTESQVSEGLKSIQDAVGNNQVKEVPDSVVSEFLEKIRAVNNGEYAQALRALEDFASTAGIPLKLKKQLGELKLDLQTVATMLSTMVATIALAKDSGQPQPSPPTPVLPNPVPPTPVLPKASPPIPFEKIGKRSIEVLYADYVQAPLHAEVQCRFKLGNHSFPAKLGNPSFPTILTKIQSVPEVSLTLKHKQLWGNGVKGGLCFVLPFGTSSLAKIQYLNERACLNANLGLYVNPPIKISGMYGSNGICGGGSFTFNAQSGGLTGLDAGVCLSNPEWGIFSASAKMLKGPEGAHGRALRVLYSQDVMKNKTIAADVAYNYEDSTVVVTAGVEHRVDDLMLIKGRLSSDGTVACMVQFKEGLAGSTFRAMAQTNVGSLQLPPRVGFSITTDPTK